MQTLIFNTTKKYIRLTSGSRGSSSIIENMENITTVKVSSDGFYEVMQKLDESSNAIPVMRLPISNTNMIIEK